MIIDHYSQFVISINDGLIIPKRTEQFISNPNGYINSIKYEILNEIKSLYTHSGYNVNELKINECNKIEIEYNKTKNESVSNYIQKDKLIHNDEEIEKIKNQIYKDILYYSADDIIYPVGTIFRIKSYASEMNRINGSEFYHMDFYKNFPTRRKYFNIALKYLLNNVFKNYYHDSGIIYNRFRLIDPNRNYHIDWDDDMFENKNISISNIRQFVETCLTKVFTQENENEDIDDIIMDAGQDHLESLYDIKSDYLSIGHDILYLFKCIYFRYLPPDLYPLYYAWHNINCLDKMYDEYQEYLLNISPKYYSEICEIINKYSDYYLE